MHGRVDRGDAEVLQAGGRGGAGPFRRGAARLRAGLSDAAEAMAPERGRLMLWAPVCFGVGIQMFFSARQEPSGWAVAVALALVVLAAPSAMRLRAAAAWILAAAALIAAGFSAAALRAHVEERLPEDCRAEFHEHGAAAATILDTAMPAFEAARQELTEEWGVEAAFVGCGGSIPTAGHFPSILGMQSLMVGFARDDDAIHSPNEKYELSSFHKGIRSWARILAALADKG